MSKKYSGRTTFEIFVEECANDMKKANDKMDAIDNSTNDEETYQLDIEGTLERIDTLYASLPELHVQFVLDKKESINEEINELKEMAAGYFLNPDKFMGDKEALAVFEEKVEEIDNYIKTYHEEFTKLKECSTLGAIEYGIEDLKNKFTSLFAETMAKLDDTVDYIEYAESMIDRYKYLESKVNTLSKEDQKTFEQYLLEERLNLFYHLSSIDSNIRNYDEEDNYEE